LYMHGLHLSFCLLPMHGRGVWGEYVVFDDCQ
jgi:hypothetical protein